MLPVMQAIPSYESMLLANLDLWSWFAHSTFIDPSMHSQCWQSRVVPSWPMDALPTFLSNNVWTIYEICCNHSGFMVPCHAADGTTTSNCPTMVHFANAVDKQPHGGNRYWLDCLFAGAIALGENIWSVQMGDSIIAIGGLLGLSWLELHAWTGHANYDW